MASRDSRFENLNSLLVDNGGTRLRSVVDVDAQTSTDDIQRLDDWYRSRVEPNPADLTRMMNRWYVVAMDIGLYLGERAVSATNGRVCWKLFTQGKRDVSYQRPVIMGFDVPNPKYNFDPMTLVVWHGIAVVQRRTTSESKLVDMYRRMISPTSRLEE